MVQTSGGEDPKVPGTEPITQERPVSHPHNLGLLLCCACSGSITRIWHLQRFQTQLLLSAPSPLHRLWYRDLCQLLVTSLLVHSASSIGTQLQQSQPVAVEHKLAARQISLQLLHTSLLMFPQRQAC